MKLAFGFLAVLLSSTLFSVHAANAKCVGSGYSLKLGTSVDTTVVISGKKLKCSFKVNGSQDPLYGAGVVIAPKHGRLQISDRTLVQYFPSPGFSGDDSFTFELVGKRGGTTADSVKVNVRATMK